MKRHILIEDRTTVCGAPIIFPSGTVFRGEVCAECLRELRVQRRERLAVERGVREAAKARRRIAKKRIDREFLQKERQQCRPSIN